MLWISIKGQAEKGKQRSTDRREENTHTHKGAGRAHYQLHERILRHREFTFVRRLSVE